MRRVLLLVAAVCVGMPSVAETLRLKKKSAGRSLHRAIGAVTTCRGLQLRRPLDRDASAARLLETADRFNGTLAPENVTKEFCDQHALTVEIANGLRTDLDTASKALRDLLPNGGAKGGRNSKYWAVRANALCNATIGGCKVRTGSDGDCNDAVKTWWVESDSDSDPEPCPKRPRVIRCDTCDAFLCPDCGQCLSFDNATSPRSRAAAWNLPDDPAKTGIESGPNSAEPCAKRLRFDNATSPRSRAAAANLPSHPLCDCAASTCVHRPCNECGGCTCVGGECDGPDCLGHTCRARTCDCPVGKWTRQKYIYTGPPPGEAAEFLCERCNGGKLEANGSPCTECGGTGTYDPCDEKEAGFGAKLGGERVRGDAALFTWISKSYTVADWPGFENFITRRSAISDSAGD